MANIGSVLKAEITRLARKEVKAQVDTLRKAASTYRRDIAELKRQVAQLERTARHSSKRQQVSAAPATPGKTRFVAKGLRSLRQRLGLSAAEFGRLANASGQSIYNWESGKTIPAKSQQAALAALRGLGKREARAQLDSMA
ncbi:MAG: hypothetical protein EPO46_06690 [Lysobacter sp.]|nr:MAG: hypothetical protein EPO46_06690 [Lysobacter sp.]